MAMVKLPRAFKFTPTDYEIIGYYLIQKVKDLAIPGNIISEESVYTLHPRSLNWNHVPHLYNYERYYFAKREEIGKTNRGKRAKRAFENGAAGFWRLSTGEKKILDPDRNVVGVVSSLNFWEYKDPNNKDRRQASKTDYLMSEYKLLGDQFQEWVVCRIKDKKRVPRKGDETNVDYVPQLQNQVADLVQDNITQQEQVHHVQSEQQQEVPQYYYQPPLLPNTIDEQHHDMELNQELQGILDLINNISDDELFDKQVQTMDEIPAPQSPS